MSDEITTWGKFETRSIVRDKIPVEMHYDPEIEKEMAGYTVDKFVTRSVVRPKQHVNCYRVRPYLKVTLALSREAKLTREEAMNIGAKLLGAVMEAAPVKLEYSSEHSKVEDGKLIAALVPHDNTDDAEWMLREFAERLKDLPLCDVPTPAPLTGEIDFLPVVKV